MKLLYFLCSGLQHQQVTIQVYISFYLSLISNIKFGIINVAGQKLKGKVVILIRPLLFYKKHILHKLKQVPAQTNV